MKLIASLVLVGTLSLLPATTGCKGANFPVIDNVAKIVLTDLLANDSEEQIELDVAAVSPVGADVVTLTFDAINALVDFGLIPSSALPNAQAAKAKLAAKIAARAPVASTSLAK